MRYGWTTAAAAFVALLELLLVHDATCLTPPTPNTVHSNINDSSTSTTARALLLPHKLRQAWVTASVVAATLLYSHHGSTASAAETLDWNLLNGNVQLPTTITLDVTAAAASQSSHDSPHTNAASIHSHTSRCRLILRDPALIGAGAGGAVFRFADDSPTLLKVSWAGSAAQSVARECDTLQRLAEAKVQGVEQCLGQFPYGSKDDDERVMIVVEPYVKDAVSSIADLNDATKQGLAVAQVARTLVQMLAANSFTIDVQPLISPATGEVIFIDMTEAQTLHPPFSFLDTTLMSSFATEMLTLIPDTFLPLATKTVWLEIELLETDKGTTLSSEAMDILSSQLELSSTG
jgi:hypothetical protein